MSPLLGEEKPGQRHKALHINKCPAWGWLEVGEGAYETKVLLGTLGSLRPTPRSAESGPKEQSRRERSSKVSTKVPMIIFCRSARQGGAEI